MKLRSLPHINYDLTKRRPRKTKTVPVSTKIDPGAQAGPVPPRLDKPIHMDGMYISDASLAVGNMFNDTFVEAPNTILDSKEQVKTSDYVWVNATYEMMKHHSRKEDWEEGEIKEYAARILGIFQSISSADKRILEIQWEKWPSSQYVCLHTISSKALVVPCGALHILQKTT